MTTMVMKGSGVGLVATLFASILLILNNGELAKAYDPYVVATTSWMAAKATFYGGKDASGTMNGGCGYANPFALGYGTQTTALSNALFNKGLTCGACFEIKCAITRTAYAKQWCYANNPSIYITATNLCPEGSYGGWCNGANLHFDLAYAAFVKLAQENAGVIPVNYRRTPCKSMEESSSS